MCSNNGITIAGPSTICNAPQVYTLTNAPIGAGNTINWVPSVPNMVNIVLSADRTQATVTGVGNGNVTLQVTISNVNCGSLVVNSASINVGGIDNAGLFINHQTLCAGYPTEFGAEYGTLGYCTLLQAGITDVEWDVASPYPYQIEENYSPLGCLEVSNSGRMISFSQQYSPYTVQVRIRAKNACGWSDWSPYYSLTVQDCGGGWYMVSPNPATSEVTVTASNNKTTTTSNTTITEVNIYDQTGTLKKQQKFGKVRKATLNISNLPYGVYIIEIVNGSYKERQQLSIIKQ